MSNHKSRAQAACIAVCTNATCSREDECRWQEFDSLLGHLPRWWKYLPDGGEARRGALADALGRQMFAAAGGWSAPN